MSWRKVSRFVIFVMDQIFVLLWSWWSYHSASYSQQKHEYIAFLNERDIDISFSSLFHQFLSKFPNSHENRLSFLFYLKNFENYWYLTKFHIVEICWKFFWTWKNFVEIFCWRKWAYFLEFFRTQKNYAILHFYWKIA